MMESDDLLSQMQIMESEENQDSNKPHSFST